MKKTRRTPEQWQALVQQQATSGLSAVDFCRRHQLDAQYFSKRKRSLQAQAASPGGAFVKVQLASPQAVSVTTMVLHYRHTQLHVSADADVHALAQLMRLLS